MLISFPQIRSRWGDSIWERVAKSGPFPTLSSQEHTEERKDGDRRNLGALFMDFPSPRPSFKLPCYFLNGSDIS
jgi:hypothetical protein